jgi:acyl carrier protein
MNDDLKNTIAEELEVAPETLQPDTVLDDITGWDSVVALTIMVIIGDERGYPVLPNEIKELKTFGDIELLVGQKQ